MRDQFLSASALISTICEIPGTGGRGENETPCPLPISVRRYSSECASVCLRADANEALELVSEGG